MTNGVTLPAGRFLDFDALWDEIKPAPIVIKIFGKEEELPANLPAATVLGMMKQQRTGKLDNLEAPEAMELGISVFGRERVERWSNENGLDILQLAELLKRVVQMYTAYQPHTGETATGGSGKKAGSL